MLCGFWTFAQVPHEYPTSVFLCCKVVLSVYCVYSREYMNTLKETLKNNVVMFGAFISIAWIISSFVLAHGLSSINTHDAISVTGTAERMVESDAAKWNFMLTKQSSPENYNVTAKQLKDAQVATVKYLVAHGVDEKSITIQPITSTVICQSQNQVMYDGSGRQQCSGAFTYSLVQTIIAESEDVKNIKQLSLDAPTALATLGAQLQTVSVDFFYTKLASIRAELLQEASKNAKERAVAIAKSTGNRIGGVKDASQGVFQVTQKNSTDVSDYGSYDTSTVEKKITAIVRASFEVR